MSDGEREQLEREIDSSQAEVDRLREEIRRKVTEANRIEERDRADGAERDRRRQLAEEIDRLSEQIDVLTAAMKRQAEARAERYRE